MTDRADTDNTITLDSSGTEYSLENAAILIDDLIEVLEDARRDGATYVALESGNQRGPRWVKLYPSTSLVEE